MSDPLKEIIQEQTIADLQRKNDRLTAEVERLKLQQLGRLDPKLVQEEMDKKDKTIKELKSQLERVVELWESDNGSPEHHAAWEWIINDIKKHTMNRQEFETNLKLADYEEDSTVGYFEWNDYAHNILAEYDHLKAEVERLKEELHCAIHCRDWCEGTYCNENNPQP